MLINEKSSVFFVKMVKMFSQKNKVTKLWHEHMHKNYTSMKIYTMIPGEKSLDIY